MNPPGEPRISARTAAVLARDPALRRLRVAYVADSQLHADLLTITVIGYAHETNATGNATGIAIGVSAADDCTMTTSQAAAVSGVTPNAIRRAIREGRLAARRRGGRWVTDAVSVARYTRGLADG